MLCNSLRHGIPREWLKTGGKDTIISTGFLLCEGLLVALQPHRLKQNRCYTSRRFSERSRIANN